MKPDDTNISDNDRLREIVAILAAGILRLQRRAALPTAASAPMDPEKPVDPALNCLEVPDKTRLSGHTG